MHYTEIPKTEKEVQNGLNGHFKLEAFSIPIKEEESQLNGYLIRRSNEYNGYYYNERFPKEKIVLHFTAGHLRGDLTSLTDVNRGHVSVPFLIARDGTIYQLFSSAAWSYHLGPSAIGGNATQSKKSIAIELSNYGSLTMIDGNLETIYSRLKNKKTGKIGSKDIYCSKQDKGLYVKLDEPFKKERYFATYTDAQYDSLVILLRYLTAEYDIPRAFLDSSIRYQDTEQVVSFRGILSHVNYRKEGKWDIGPAFDWDRIIKGVKAAAYTPEAKIKMAITEEKAKLKQAKKELTLAQKKVDTILQAIADLENSIVPTSRSIDAIEGFQSESAIDKVHKPNQQKLKSMDLGEGVELDDNLKSRYYL